MLVRSASLVQALLLVLLLVPAWCHSAHAARRVALVVGNSAYATPLRSPAKDAAAMETKLRDAGFDLVRAYHDLDNMQFKQAIHDFAADAVDADIAIVYFSGHGAQIHGVNYVLPVDATLAGDRGAGEQAIAVDRLSQAVKGARRMGLVILDACRESQLVDSMQRTGDAPLPAAGLSVVEPTSPHTLIAYAARRGSAVEDVAGPDSPFTGALLHHLFVPGLEVRFAFGRVRNEVLERTRHQQEPYVAGSLGSGFVSLVPPAVGPAAAAAAGIQVRAGEPIDYELIVNIGRKEAWELFLEQHPAGLYSSRVRRQLDELDAAQSRANPPASAKGAAEQPTRERDNALKPPEQERRANVEPGSRIEQTDPVCNREEELLATLNAAGRQGWVRQDLKRLERELGCERLRPGVAAALERLGPEGAVPAVPAPAPSPPVARAEPDDGPVGMRSLAAPASEPDAQCRREEALLVTLEAAGGQGWARNDLKRLERELGCERLRARVVSALKRLSAEPAAPASGRPDPGR
ncbi:MAG TPA: caspase family protein [Xanthobacteraceae bacterium]